MATRILANPDSLPAPSGTIQPVVRVAPAIQIQPVAEPIRTVRPAVVGVVPSEPPPPAPITPAAVDPLDAKRAALAADIGGTNTVYRDDTGAVSTRPPGSFGFCTSPTQEQYRAYKKNGTLPPRDLSRHPDSINPEQCENAFFDDLVNLRGYVEEPGEIILDAAKNLGAGIINSVVPGADLGDSNSVLRDIGQVIGTIGAGVAIVGAVSKIGIVSKAIGTVENVAAPLVATVEASKPVSLVSTIGGLLSSPVVNTIVGSVVRNVTAPKTAPAYTQGIVPAPTSPSVTIDANGVKLGTNIPPSSTTQPATQMPAWLLPVVAIAAAFLFLPKLLSRRR